jgi:hypothetical protein
MGDGIVRINEFFFKIQFLKTGWNHESKGDMLRNFGMLLVLFVLILIAS